MSTFKDQLSQFSSSIGSGLVETRIIKGSRQHVCIGKHLVAIAFVQSRQGNQAALRLEFESMNGNIKRCIISRCDLVGRGGKKIFATLLSRGYYYELKQREALLDYLSGLGCELPEIIADETDRICLDLDKLVFDGDVNNDTSAFQLNTNNPRARCPLGRGFN
jgi:hypothetical protein